MNKRNVASVRFALLAGIAISGDCTGRVWAQDSAPAAVPVPPPSTVVKNRSPIEIKPLEVKIPAARESVLTNGTRVFIVEDSRTPLVTFTVSVRGGALFEAAGKAGVADLVASTLTEGTKSYSADQIAVLTDKYGASFGAGAGDERAVVSLTCLAENAATLLPVLAEIVYEPSFPDDRFQRVRDRAQAGATARLSDPNVLAAEALRAVLYGADSAYGRASAPPDQIGLLSVMELKTFHGKHFRPDTAYIGVAGNVSAEDMTKVLEQIFGKRGKPSEPPAELPPAVLISQSERKSGATPSPVIIDRPGSAQSVLNFGVPGINRSNPDYFALLLANRILGGGFNSRLNQKLREEKGYTYGARSSLSAPKWTGLWSSSASVRNAVTGAAANDFLGEFVRLQNTPPKEGELALVKQALIGNFALTLESPEAILARSIERYEFGLAPDYWSTYANRVRAVTPTDVVRAARKYLGVAGDPNNVSKPRVWAVAVGEKSAIEGELNQAMSQGQ